MTAIELIDQVIPDRAARWLRAFGALCALVYITLLAWHMVQPALDYIEFDEITMDLQLPLLWQAALILTGLGTAVPANQNRRGGSDCGAAMAAFCHE